MIRTVVLSFSDAVRHLLETRRPAGEAFRNAITLTFNVKTSKFSPRGRIHT